MCFCCCDTRKSLIIYCIVICTIAFIYGIIAIANFGSSTEFYASLMERLEELESKKSSFSTSSSSSYSSPFSTYSYPYNLYKTKNNRRIDNSGLNNLEMTRATVKYAESLLNSVSYAKIQGLTEEDLRGKNYSMIKSLKAIENSIGTILFIFPLTFLIDHIVFLIFACGDKEYRIMSNTVFGILNGLLIGSLIISIILIFLSILYGVLLVVIYIEYFFLLLTFDTCLKNIIIQMAFGYYGFWFYITLSCAFCRERTHLTNIGCVEKPGPNAKFDINGNPIIQNSTVIQPVIIGGQFMQQQIPQMVQVQQQSPNNIPYSNSNINGDQYIVCNGITYKKIDNINNNYNNNFNNNNFNNNNLNNYNFNNNNNINNNLNLNNNQNINTNQKEKNDLIEKCEPGKEGVPDSKSELK